MRCFSSYPWALSSVYFHVLQLKRTSPMHENSPPQHGGGMQGWGGWSVLTKFQLSLNFN
uniref:Uncharacterized protein n=1 Tax=Rhizophora mucronata TaxID=61149 RepID=A0A2P2N6Z3_RHIMU